MKHVVGFDVFADAVELDKETSNQYGIYIINKYVAPLLQGSLATRRAGLKNL
jgi:hypothetical protein